MARPLGASDRTTGHGFSCFHPIRPAATCFKPMAPGALRDRTLPSAIVDPSIGANRGSTPSVGSSGRSFIPQGPATPARAGRLSQIAAIPVENSMPLSDVRRDPTLEKIFGIDRQSTLCSPSPNLALPPSRRLAAPRLRLPRPFDHSLGRRFSSSLGIVPREHSSGLRRHLGSITKNAAPRTPIHGAAGAASANTIASGGPCVSTTPRSQLRHVRSESPAPGLSSIKNTTPPKRNELSRLERVISIDGIGSGQAD